MIVDSQVVTEPAVRCEVAATFEVGMTLASESLDATIITA